MCSRNLLKAVLLGWGSDVQPRLGWAFPWGAGLCLYGCQLGSNPNKTLWKPGAATCPMISVATVAGSLLTTLHSEIASFCLSFFFNCCNFASKSYWGQLCGPPSSESVWSVFILLFLLSWHWSLWSPHYHYKSSAVNHGKWSTLSHSPVTHPWKRVDILYLTWVWTHSQFLSPLSQGSINQRSQRGFAGLLWNKMLCGNKQLTIQIY